MGVEIHEIWKTVKRILEILDVIYHKLMDEEGDEPNGEE